MKRYPGVAVRALIRDDQGRVLLLQRRNTAYFNGQWCLPGGKCEFGQRLEEAINKEVQEETSLSVEERRFLFFEESLPDTESTLHYVIFYFYCRTTGPVSVNEESAGHAWVKPEELETYKIPAYHRLAIRRALSML